MQLSSNTFNFVYNQTRISLFTKFSIFFFIYLTILLFIALPEGSNTSLVDYKVPNPQCKNETSKNTNCEPLLQLKINATARDYLNFFNRGNDPGSYVRGGLLLAGHKWDGTVEVQNKTFKEKFRLMNLVGFGMWPPGMFLMNYIPLKFNVNVKIGLYQLIIANTIWACTFALVSLLLFRNRRLYALFPPILLFFPLFNQYLLRQGVMYSETYGIALLIMAFSLITAFFSLKKKKTAMFFAGICFAIGSFFRSQVFPIAMGTIAILFVFYIIKKVKNNSTTESQEIKQKILVPILILSMSFAIPLITYIKFNHGALFRVPVAWQLPFTVPEYPHAGSRNFLAQGGMRAACIVDLDKCNEIANRIKTNTEFTKTRNDVLKAFVFHPIKFSSYKLPYAWNFWMEGSSIEHGMHIKWDNSVILAMFVLCLLYMAINKLWLLFFISISTFGLVLGPPFLIHFESRYFYILKTFILFLPFWLFIIENHKNLMNKDALSKCFDKNTLTLQ